LALIANPIPSKIRTVIKNSAIKKKVGCINSVLTGVI
jgi:hypothetical protein